MSRWGKRWDFPAHSLNSPGFLGVPNRGAFARGAIGNASRRRRRDVRGSGQVLAPLAALAAERGVAVVLVCHTRKAVASFADDMALGRRAFVGLARSVLHLMADPDNEKRKLLLPGKCNLSAPPPGLAFRIVGDPDFIKLGDGDRRHEVRKPREIMLRLRGPWPTGVRLRCQAKTMHRPQNPLAIDPPTA